MENATLFFWVETATSVSWRGNVTHSDANQLGGLSCKASMCNQGVLIFGHLEVVLEGRTSQWEQNREQLTINFSNLC